MNPTIIATYPKGIVSEGSFKLVAAYIMYWVNKANRTTRKKANMSLASIYSNSMVGASKLDKIEQSVIWPIYE